MCIWRCGGGAGEGQPQGYKAQADAVMESLRTLVAACEGRRQSLVVEGVHLAPNAVLRLMRQHPSVVPFLIYIRWPPPLLPLSGTQEALPLPRAPQHNLHLPTPSPFFLLPGSTDPKSSPSRHPPPILFTSSPL